MSSFAMRPATAPILAALAMALIPAAPAARADIVTVDYTTLGTFTAASLDVGGITVTGGPGLLSVAAPAAGVDFDGLAVAGGLPQLQTAENGQSIDPTESVTFTFDSGTRTGVRARLGGEGGFGVGGTPGVFVTITARGAGGVALGSFSGSLTPNIDADFGGAAISSFTLTPTGDSDVGSFFSIAGVDTGVPFVPMPEPASIALLGVGGLAAALASARKRKSPSPRGAGGASGWARLVVGRSSPIS